MNSQRSLYKYGEEGTLTARPEMKQMLERFIGRCKEQGVTRLKEWSTTPGEYLQSYSRLFNKMDEDVVSIDKKIIALTEPSSKYQPKGLKALTDGLFGSFDYAVNWVGYEGEHMEFILDLGKSMPVSSVNIDFLNAANDWIFLPEYVSYATSVDGKEYAEPKQVNNPNNPRKGGIFVQSYQADLNRQARYIKVHAQSLINCPAWHPGASSPAWIFADEIVVK